MIGRIMESLLDLVVILFLIMFVIGLIIIVSAFYQSATRAPQIEICDQDTKLIKLEHMSCANVSSGRVSCTYVYETEDHGRWSSNLVYKDGDVVCAKSHWEDKK